MIVKKILVLPIFLLAFLMILSCKTEKKEPQISENRNVQNNGNLQSVGQNGKDSTIANRKIPQVISTYHSKFIAIENVLINGHEVILPKKQFEELYPNIDSTKTDVWECGDPFEWLDKEWLEKTYGAANNDGESFENYHGEVTTIYGKNIEFTTNSHMVLFDEALAENNSLTIKSHNITLDKNTTLEQFKKIFPNTEIENFDNSNELRARFYLGKEIDDAFLFYFKDGKLISFTLWWLLC